VVYSQKNYVVVHEPHTAEHMKISNLQPSTFNLQPSTFNLQPSTFNLQLILKSAMRQINYPFYIDGRGRVAQATNEQHLRQLIEQVLFTAPGERVNRPDFGSNIQQLLFAPNNDELATATEFLVRGALEQWLGELIQVEAVSVESEDANLNVTVQYRIRRNQQPQIATFSREV
jgi:uncharacterized protein